MKDMHKVLLYDVTMGCSKQILTSPLSVRNIIGLSFFPIQLNFSPKTHQIVHLKHVKLQNYPIKKTSVGALKYKG